jgi:hypothetical protein
MAEATKKKKRATYGTSMGVSSIIAILVILVLVVFSALSITTAKADLTLSQKTANSIEAYYEADATAETVLAEVVGQLGAGSQITPAGDAEDFSIEPVAGGNLLTFSINIDAERNLNVRVLITPAGDFQKQLWQVVPSGEWEADDDIKLFQ